MGTGGPPKVGVELAAILVGRGWGEGARPAPSRGTWQESTGWPCTPAQSMLGVMRWV